MNYKNRVYGFVAVKAINSNYNADFSGQPRTLPNGQVYATDKALKYTVRHYIKNVYPVSESNQNISILFYKRLQENLSPFDLAGAYDNLYKGDVKKDSKSTIINNLLSSIDVRLFGATFAPKGSGIKDKNVSIHGPVQINHGANIWHEGNIYSEQITAPFRSPDEKKEDKSATTIGRQSKLEEGHYVHHFSVNPKNLEEVVVHGGEGTDTLTQNDIDLLKEGLRKGATYYDSASKAGTENEMLFWVKLNADSKIVLPNFTNLIKVTAEGQKRKFDLSELTVLLKKYSNEIESVELYCNSQGTLLEGADSSWEIKNL